MVEHSDAVRLFERRRDAWLAEDLEGYLACFADDIVMEVPGLEPVVGIGPYREMVVRSLRALRPVSFDFHALAVHENRVLSEWTIVLELRSNGREVAYRGMGIAELADDRIRTWREYYDASLLTPATSER